MLCRFYFPSVVVRIVVETKICQHFFYAIVVEKWFKDKVTEYVECNKEIVIIITFFAFLIPLWIGSRLAPHVADYCLVTHNRELIIFGAWAREEIR